MHECENHKIRKEKPNFHSINKIGLDILTKPNFNKREEKETNQNKIDKFLPYVFRKIDC